MTLSAKEKGERCLLGKKRDINTTTDSGSERKKRNNVKGGLSEEEELLSSRGGGGGGNFFKGKRSVGLFPGGPGSDVLRVGQHQKTNLKKWKKKRFWQ